MASEQLDTLLVDDIEHTSSRPIIDENVLECAICEGRLNNPKYLSCYHTFCLKCLEDWVNRNSELLSCPTCSKSCSIPEEGLQGLPPNTSLANLLETIEQFTNADQMKCVCGKEGKSENYCQDCRQFLCLNCSGHHKNIRSCKNHKLQPLEDVRSMSVKDIIATYPPLCSIHNEPLSSFCKICNIPICFHCSITNHKEWEGIEKHTPLVNLSDEFKALKEASTELEKLANQCIEKMKDKVVLDLHKKLEENKAKSLKDIDNHVEELTVRIKESGETFKREVEKIYNKKMKDFQIVEQAAALSDINTYMCLLHHLQESDGAAAISTGQSIIRALGNTIKEAPTTMPEDNNVEITFVKNKKQIVSLQEDIGMVIQTSEAAVSLELDVLKCVTTDQVIEVKIVKTAECHLNENDLEVTWTQPSGEINTDQIEEDKGDYYIVRRKCKTAGVCQIDARVNGKPIKKSPMTIQVEKSGLIQTVRMPGNSDSTFIDVVKDKHESLLVSCQSNAIHKYKQSGGYVGKIVLPSDVKVNRLFKMKNGNIAFTDCGKTESIKICTMGGEIVKSVGENKVNGLCGIHVDEETHIVYVCNGKCIIMFNIESGETISKQNVKGYDLVLTRQKNILILNNDGIHLLNDKGQSSKVIIGSGSGDSRVKNPNGVEVDDNDNIIVASKNKLQLFSKSGEFIKRIDNNLEFFEKQPVYLKMSSFGGGLSLGTVVSPAVVVSQCSQPRGLSIISTYPRRVALLNGNTVQIFNY